MELVCSYNDLIAGIGGSPLDKLGEEEDSYVELHCSFIILIAGTGTGDTKYLDVCG